MSEKTEKQQVNLDGLSIALEELRTLDARSFDRTLRPIIKDIKTDLVGLISEQRKIVSALKKDDKESEKVVTV